MREGVSEVLEGDRLVEVMRLLDIISLYNSLEIHSILFLFFFSFILE